MAALAATVALLLLDLAGAPGPAWLRAAAATVLGPLERAVSPDADGTSASSPATQARAGAASAVASRDRHEEQQLRDLLEAPETRGAQFVPARVVALGSQGVARAGRVSIDVGSRDGIRPGLMVVAADGLVGRIVSSAPWTSDVLVVGSPDLRVGVRAGAAGVLGSVTSPGPGQERTSGQLSLTIVDGGRVATGDVVTTLGSVGGSPFLPGVRVGTVASVDPSGGVLSPTAAVVPAVDPSRIDIVGVLLSAPRGQPRAAVTGGSR